MGKYQHQQHSQEEGELLQHEYQENGPLFSELKFYQRGAKPKNMQIWMKNKQLNFLGIPAYWGSGLAEYNDLRKTLSYQDKPDNQHLIDLFSSAVRRRLDFTMPERPAGTVLNLT
ncbi:serine/threonine-protein kinase VRK1-like [Menidia menidia]